MLTKLDKKPGATRNAYIINRSKFQMSQVTSLTTTEEHRCFEIQSEKTRLLEFMKNDMLKIDWQHQTCQRLSDTLFKRALSHFGEHFIERTGYPKPGINEQ